jgi:hypothetical protein
VREWLSSLTLGRVPELALALAAGYAAWSLAGGIAHSAVHVLAQHVGRFPSDEEGTVLGLLNLFSAGPYVLNFSLGGTVVVYGEVLSATLALGLVLLAGLGIVRWRNRKLGVCPFCASRIPHESTHCAFCGSGVEAAVD